MSIIASTTSGVGSPPAEAPCSFDLDLPRDWEHQISPSLLAISIYQVPTVCHFPCRVPSLWG